MRGEFYYGAGIFAGSIICMLTIQFGLYGLLGGNIGAILLLMILGNTLGFEK